MQRIKRILVATDYSDDARRAETRAAMLSFELKADTLEMMTVHSAAREPGASDGAWLAERLAMAEEAAGRTMLPGRANGMKVVRSVRSGDPAAAVLSRAAEMAADLTVVPVRGTAFLADLLGGANHALAHGSDAALLLVKREPQSAYRRILVAVDFSAGSEAAARFALDLAPAARFTFVHACQIRGEGALYDAGFPESAINAFRERDRDAARRMLDALIGSLGRKGTPIAAAAETGHPVRLIGEIARRFDADLIVIGKNGTQCDREPATGGIALRLLGGHEADLLIVPAAGPDDWTGRPAA